MTGQETISPTTWFVTGCSRGLGLAFVRALSKEACNIVIATCRSPSSARALNAIAKECNAHPGDLGELYVVRLDVEDETSIKEAADEAERILEPKGLGLDYLLNNAGILFEDHMIPFNIDNFMATMRANVVGPALITAALLPLLRKGRRGVVMNMSSTMGSIGSDMGLKMGTYSMSKAALNMMTYKQAQQAPDLIPIVMCPGWVKTDMGGSGAQIGEDESIPRIVEILKHLKPEDAGSFFNYLGERVPW